MQASVVPRVPSWSFARSLSGVIRERVACFPGNRVNCRRGPPQAQSKWTGRLWESRHVAIRSFATKGTEDIFNQVRSKIARRTCPEGIWPVARRKLYLLNAVTRLADLAIPRGNELEALKSDRKGQHSIRINEQYRVCFRWTEDGPEDVEITDYH